MKMTKDHTCVYEYDKLSVTVFWAQYLSVCYKKSISNCVCYCPKKTNNNSCLGSNTFNRVLY